MKREKLIEDYDVYKKRLMAVMECFKIEDKELATYVGVRRIRMLIAYKPNQEQLELIAKFCNVSIEFLKGKMLESYTAKEVDVLIYLERKKMKQEISQIKKTAYRFCK